jgi:hypothetical protein
VRERHSVRAGEEDVLPTLTGVAENDSEVVHRREGVEISFQSFDSIR